MFRRALPGTLALLVLAPSDVARAAVGPACDVNPPTSTQACIDAIQANGGVVNDIFRDSQGRTAQQLPVFGKLYNIYPGCDAANCAGCDPGFDTPPYDCPGEYTCDGGTRDTAGFALFNDVANAVNTLDHVWGHPCRLTQHGLVNGCPQFGTCAPDGTPGDYYPWEGFVFDLGGLSNQVAIFAMNDHGPQPCESLEYTVFLTNNPQSQDIVSDPATMGADPNKWNRAVLSKVFTEGWFTTRAPDPTGHGATCGDTAQYAVENDAFVQVFKLPCGADFRYAAIVAGNDGKDFPACAYDSEEAELDAVAGLTEQGAGVQRCLHPPCVFDSPCADGGLTSPDASGGGSGSSSSSGGSGSGASGSGGSGSGGDGGPEGDATVGGNGDSGGAGTSGSSGCGCNVPGATQSGLAAAIGTLAALAGVIMGRRRRTRPLP